MVRPESWTRPAGASPARVGVGTPGSRPRFVGEIRRAERGVESLFGGSKRAGRSASESCSLVTITTGEPSRSCHGEGHVDRAGSEAPGWSLRGRWSGTHARPGHGTGETRLSSLVSKDRSYKPMVKSSGGQRESDGVVVPRIAVQHNAAGGKGPDFGHVGDGGKRKGMAGTARHIYPGGRQPVGRGSPS